MSRTDAVSPTCLGGAQMTLTEGDNVPEALLLNRTNEPLGVGVQVRALRGEPMRACCHVATKFTNEGQADAASSVRQYAAEVLTPGQLRVALAEAEARTSGGGGAS
jgi:hypothetical protein